MEGVYSSRKIEQLCRNHIQFILLLDGHEPPDHCTIARFRSGAATGKAIEGLFWQYVNCKQIKEQSIHRPSSI